MPRALITRITGQDGSYLAELLVVPLKVVLVAYFRIFMPILCHVLDRIDKDKCFTVGYFVEAKRGR